MTTHSTDPSFHIKHLLKHERKMYWFYASLVRDGIKYYPKAWDDYIEKYKNIMKKYGDDAYWYRYYLSTNNPYFHKYAKDVLEPRLDPDDAKFILKYGDYFDNFFSVEQNVKGSGSRKKIKVKKGYKTSINTTKDPYNVCDSIKSVPFIVIMIALAATFVMNM